MNAAKERDYRLDFCRGLALLAIFIDHVPGNPLSNWTLRRFAFCDAAEVFVLISGMATYLAYGSRLERFGFQACAAAIGRRWLKLYGAHLLLLAILAVFIGVALPRFTANDYLGFMRMNWLFDRPREAIVAALTLRFLPTYLDILPLYLMLLAMAPALIWLVKRDWRIALAASGAIYAAIQWTGFNLSAGNDGSGWFFNPFAWQFLYTMGLVFGRFHANPPRIAWRKSSWLAAAAAFAVFGVIAAAPWTGSETGFAFFNPPIYLWPANKTFLPPLRLLNVLALWYLFVYFFPPQAAMVRGWFARPLLWCGQHSLPIYGLGVFLSCAGYVAVNESAGAPAMHAAVNVAGIAISLSAAAALEWRRRTATGRIAPAASSEPSRRSAGAWSFARVRAQPEPKQIDG
ncbi:MAG: OpgC family protein [Candidatus Binataceae bacterium]